MVVITSPVEDATLSSATTIRVDATDDTGVEKVDFLIDGQTVATDTEEPWEHLWQVSYYADGETHSILAKASDGAENVGQSDLVHVFVSENAQETPIPQTPENYTVERNSNLIELSWTSINGAEEYIVLVSSSNEFTDTEYSITTSDTTVTTDALTDGMHYWKVRAKNSVGNYGEWSNYFTFEITGPEAPVLLSPENGAVIADAEITDLSWSTSEFAETYDVIVSSSNEFTDTEYSITTSDTTVTTDALTDGMHYWKVRAKNSVGNYGEWSNYFTFEITGPEAPTLLSPENGEIIADVDFANLVWSTSEFTEIYDVIVSSSYNFTDTEYSITTSDTTVTTDALTDGMHYWKVRAKNSVGNYGEWSDVFTFRIGESSTSFQMVSLPGGTFEMGDIWGAGSSDELPTHQVTLSSFEISATEITNQQYADYLTDALAVGSVTATSSSVTGDWEGNNYEFLDLDDSDCQITYSGGQFIIDSGKENHPVIEVSWYGATGFAEYYGYRLPTEAEWEYASRGISAGEDNKWAGTSTESELTDYAWYYENWDGNYSGREVGTKLPNGNGLYDMSGNVWEWVSDWYGSYSSGSQTDPQGPNSGSYRVVRGGHCTDDAYRLRCSNRDYGSPGYTNYYIGFRISRTN
jgi:formylglycine-generating enzyme required for sulfatase activity